LGWVDLPSYLNPILIGGVISLVVVLAISRRGTVTDTERAYRMALHDLPDEERNPAETKKTQRAAAYVVVFGVAVSALLLFLYVVPYQAATDTRGDSTLLDWLTGEAVAALSWAVIFGALGVYAYKAIGRAYGKGERGRVSR
jgi:sodium/pantothenate symporter